MLNSFSKVALSVFLFLSSMLCAAEKNSDEHEINIEIKIKCPMSEGLLEFIKSWSAPRLNRTTEFALKT